jgi:NhaP-type Na+/H+ or K+/H+ antiporter
MIIFDSSSSFRIRQIDILSIPALKLTIIFLFINMIILTALTYFIIKPESLLLAILFSAIMSGTSPAVALSLLGATKNRVISLLELEALLNTPIIVILTFMIIDFATEVEEFAVSTFFGQITPFLTQIVVGIGAGMIVGLIIFKIMKRIYSEKISPLVLVTAAVLTYVLAENLKGSGVLAVVTLGLFFGNLHHIKEKKSVLEFESLFSNALRILVFVLLGTIIRFPLTLNFLIKSILLFALYVMIRFIAVNLSFRKKFEMKEKIFMALSCSKGLAVATIIFFLASMTIQGIKPILELSLLFVLFSIVTSSIAAWFSKNLLKIEVEEK